MSQTKLFNVQANRYEFVTDDELDSVLRSGRYRLPAGQTIRVQSPDGRTLEADNNTNFSMFPDYKFESGFGREQRLKLERAAKDPTQQFMAGVEAVARGATFGLSDAALAAMFDAEDVKRRKEANPVLSTVGEVGGAIGSLFLAPAGGLTGGAAKLGQLTTSVAERGLANTVLATGGTTLARDIAKRTAYSAITKGAGGFVEGSLYGVGQTISEAALGDPKEAAENLISNMTFSGLVDGSIMAATGALGSIFAKRIPPGMTKAEFNSAQTQMSQLTSGINNAQKEVADKLADSPKLASKIGDVYMKTLEKFLPLDEETKSILKPLFTDPEQGRAVIDFMNNPAEALQVVSEQMNRMVRTTEQGSKFLAVQGRRESIKRMPTRYAQNTEAGTKLAKDLLLDMDKFIATIRKNPEGYDRYAAREIKQVRDKFASRVTPTVDPLTGAPTSQPLQNNIELMDELNNVWRQIYDIKKPYESRIPGEVGVKGKRTLSKLQNIYSKVAKYTEDANVFGPQVASENAEISQMIAKHMGTVKNFESKFFSRKYIDGKPAKVFDPDKFNTFLRSDEAKRILQNDIFEEFMVSSASTLKQARKFNIEQELFREAGGVVDETFDAIANMKKLKAAMDSIRALESYTGKSLQKTLAFTALGSFFGPIVAGAAGAVGFAVDNPVQMLRYINKAQEKIIDNKSLMESTIKKFLSAGKATAEGIEAIGATVTPGKLKVPQAIRLGVVQGFEADSDEPLTLEQMLTAPTDKVVERVMYKHSELANVFPSITAEMGAQTAMALEFLKSKMPKDNNAQFQVIPNQTPYTFPPAERAKFQRYVDAINNPMDTLKKMADGTLTAEHVEALQAVYPKLYSEAQTAVLEMVADKTALNFRQKVQLGLFLGVPTMPAYDPAVFASIQQQYAIAEQEEAGMKVPKELGQNMQTSFEKAMTR